MMELIVARPTEYRGVVFKSRTEAIFARMLDLEKFVWEYEPPHLRTKDGWCPDFWAVKQITSLRKPKIMSLLIELKPAPPTETYKYELLKRFVSLGDQLSGHNPLIVCANPFDLEKPRFIHSLALGSTFTDPVFLRRLDEARRFRFDLVKG